MSASSASSGSPSTARVVSERAEPRSLGGYPERFPPASRPAPVHLVGAVPQDKERGLRARGITRRGCSRFATPGPCTELEAGELYSPRPVGPHRTHDERCANGVAERGRRSNSQERRPRPICPEFRTGQESATGDKPQLVALARAGRRKILGNNVPPLRVLVIEDQDPALGSLALDRLLQHSFRSEDRRQGVLNGYQPSLAHVEGSPQRADLTTRLRPNPDGQQERGSGREGHPPLPPTGARPPQDSLHDATREPRPRGDRCH